jgi:hypothetical protein
MEKIEMRGVQFGRSLEYSGGTQPSISNSTRNILEMHRSSPANLMYRLGHFSGASVRWESEVSYDKGIEPACAINNNGLAVEIHRTDANGKEDLWYTAGRISGNTVSFKRPNSRIDSGIQPQIALSDQNVVVEVHQWSTSRKEIVYRVGRLDPTTLNTTWGSPQRYDNGILPHVAINSRGVVVEVHQSEAHDVLYYRIGDLAGDLIRWRSAAKSYTSGVQPSVAITQDGFVIEVHKSEAYDTLWCRYGLITESDSINWTYTSAGAQFDEGQRPSLSCSGNLSVQAHTSPSYATLWYSTSRILDRSRWMADRLPVIGHNTLKEISMPGSHNAAMYDPTDDGNPLFPSGDRDQNLNVYEQLGQGVRFFDLRPKWTKGDIYIYHGNTVGPLLTSVLSDVQRFMNEGNRELVILTLTHYDGFDNDTQYQLLADKIQSYLGRWTFKRPPNDARRLADIPISEYLASTGCVLPVSSGDYFYNHRTAGIYVYRTADSADPAKGDLVVYDSYSDSDSYDYMKNDQIAKFNNFNGKCNDGVTPCDLFLLSWTLTGSGSAFNRAMEADSHLGEAMTEVQNPNSHGYCLNITYLDFSQAARPVDVCLSLYESKRQPSTGHAPLAESA